MAEVRWTQQAVDDLEAIADFIAADSPQYASLFIIDVLAAVERLTSFPNSGRIVPEISDPVIRKIVFGSYRIIYRKNGNRRKMIAMISVDSDSRPGLFVRRAELEVLDKRLVGSCRSHEIC